MQTQLNIHRRSRLIRDSYTRKEEEKNMSLLGFTDMLVHYYLCPLKLTHVTDL